MRKIVFPQESNLQPLDYRSTALPLELEKTPPRMLNFGYLNPATCLLYDCNNKSIKIVKKKKKRKWFLLRMLPWKKSCSTMQQHQKTGKQIAVKIKMAMYKLVPSVKRKEWRMTFVPPRISYILVLLLWHLFVLRILCMYMLFLIHLNWVVLSKL